MPLHELGPNAGISHNHAPPASDAGLTFVFFNPLTGDAASWDAVIGPALRGHGHGTLLWNFRGQPNSPSGDPASITAGGIVNDAVALLEAERPVCPVYVGLSIGGLFAAQAHLTGQECIGILLINTLRKASPRLEWINRAVLRAALTGGPRLIQDLYMPLLTGPGWQRANRASFFKDEPYDALDPDSGTARLLAAGIDADWDVPWERLDVPALVLSGLQDRVFFDAADVAALSARLPQAERVDLPDAGHLLSMERPDAVLDACLALARRLA